MLNITGLILGISSCLLIILHVNFELGYDQFHKSKTDIYRVVMRQPGNMVMGSTSDWWIVSPYILKPTWEKELPEIKMAARTKKENWLFKSSDQFVGEDVLVADPEIFDIFTFPLKVGKTEKALENTYSMIISEKMAKKYFGMDDPSGKIISTNTGTIFNITGVMKQIPENSHLKFDFVVSFKTLEAMQGGSLLSTSWLQNSYVTYLLLNKNFNLKALDYKLRKYDVDGFNGKKWSFHLQPLSDIHFNRQIKGTGDKSTLFIFISVGFFLLFITGFNYMNLFVAHYRARTKNIGIRRISGATRPQIIAQFLSESFLLIFISYLLSVVIVWMVLPVFNHLIGEQLDIRFLWTRNALAASFATIALMAAIAGLYPAIYLSGLQIIDGIKGGMEKFSNRAMLFRKGIVILQFSISILLLIGTITVYKQLEYATSKNLGFNKEHILFLNLNGIWYKDSDGQWKSRLETLKQELIKNPKIIKVAASSDVPSDIGWSNIPIWEERAEGEKPFFYRLNVDENFLDLYGIEIKDGREFSASRPADRDNSYILNEAAVKALNLRTPLDNGFGFDEKQGSVVGVVKDFNFESLHKPITPLGIGFSNKNMNYLSLKIVNRNIPATIRYIDDTWRGIVPNTPLKYSFLDEQINTLYQKDKQLAESLNYFSFMALFISCLGIFGLISISIKERTRELGVRKVLGVSFLNMFLLLSEDIFFITGFASVVGGFAGWYVARQWLGNFAYRFQFGPGIIVVSAFITLLMAISPVVFKILKAAGSNPVEALRNE
jgi:putative ABC transport system permease protein